GISNSNIFFKNMGPNPEGVGVATEGASTVTFAGTTGEHFKKYKLATTYLEIPLEMRYTFDPAHEDKSWKIAFGVKLGVLVDAHTKGKTLLNTIGGVENNYIEKTSSTRLFNTGRVAGTLRVGWGHFSVFGSYSITQLLKYGNAQLRPFQIGVTISGL
ncbi:MAG TPA: outer membrane beta-barrel protein, partial [Ferruginibacter sp.]|nr:outer membrane beta-barrel protein [Ferruginibacter sp.]